MTNKTYIYGIKNLENGKLEHTFFSNRTEEAKLLFGNFMIEKEPHKYNLYAIAEAKYIPQTLIWSGLEADFSNKLRDIKEKRDINDEKTSTQINIKLIGDIDKENQQEIVRKIFNGKYV